MKLLNRLPILILLIVAISSCSVNNDFIQKRKYKKGYHLSMKKKISNSANKLDKIELNKNNNLTAVTAINSEDKSEMIATVKAASIIGEESCQNNSRKKLLAKANTSQNLNLKTQVDNDLKMRIKTITNSNLKSRSNVTSQNPNSDDMLLLLYILAVFIPFVAVGIVTDWDVTHVIINLLLCVLCYIPGVIHALIKIRDNY